MPIYTHKHEPEAFVYVDEIEYGVTDVEAEVAGNEAAAPPMAHLSFNSHMLLMDLEELGEIKDLIELLEIQLAATLREITTEDDGESREDLH